MVCFEQNPAILFESMVIYLASIIFISSFPRKQSSRSVSE
jgi:hypothetical protein